MATNYAQKLASMRSRRMGQSLIEADAAASFQEKSSSLKESYESRGKGDSIKYALGAMQQLEPKYTEISINEGERVRNQLSNGLQSANIPVTFEYQGSVPLNIHIRFTSDIDLLVLHASFVTVDPAGSKANTYISTGLTPVTEIIALRRQCELILDSKFPAATIDKSGAKSISVSGGSLQRKVDVVPSHWHDTASYQYTEAKQDREVRILNKDEMILLANRPFHHMKKIEEKDFKTKGGAKKVIRLLKNLKRDSETKINLNSYEIASLVWHFSDAAITKEYYLELALVAETQLILQHLVANPSVTFTLPTPDQSRKIIDTTEKFNALILLKQEIDQLTNDLSKELSPYISAAPELIRKSLMEAHVY